MLVVHRLCVVAFLTLAAACGGPSTGSIESGDEPSSVDEISQLEDQINLDLLACAVERGLNAEMLDGGVFVPGGTREDQEILGQCQSELLADPAYAALVEPSDAVLALQYDRLLESYSCLIQEDFDPQVDPPGLEVWLGDGQSWNPFQELIDRGDSELLERAVSACSR